MEKQPEKSESLQLQPSGDEDNKSVYEGDFEDLTTSSGHNGNYFADELQTGDCSAEVPKFPTTSLIRSQRPSKISIPPLDSSDENSFYCDYSEALNPSPFVDPTTPPPTASSSQWVIFKCLFSL